MSTIAEHLATLEMCKALGEHQMFASEAYLFTQVHWKDLIDMLPPEQMEVARTEIENRILTQHPARADEFIGKWRESRNGKS